MNKTTISLPLLIAAIAYSGLSKCEFFHYRLSYKNKYNLTRHKEYSIPVWTDQQSKDWIGNIFMGQMPTKHSGCVASWGSGTEWIGIPVSSGDIRSLWMNRNNGWYGNQNTITNANPSHPNLTDVTSMFATDFGDLYLIQSSGWTILKANINQSNFITDTWIGNSEQRRYIGVSGICSEMDCSPIALGKNGYIYEYNKDLSVKDSNQVFDTTLFCPLIFKGDGRYGVDGLAYFWAYGMNNNGEAELLQISKSKESGQYTIESNELKNPVTAQIKDGVYSPHKWWSDFIPFWISDDDIRIISISNDYVNIYSRGGRLIESPIGTDRTRDISIPSWYARDGEFYDAKMILTTNNRNNWRSHQDLLVVDDFTKGNHGISRFTYTPDGYSDYFMVNVTMKDESNLNEGISRPVLGIANLSEYRQLTDFKIRLWTSRANAYPDTILADKYWSEDDSMSLSTGCSPENPNLCWVDAEFSPGYVLDPKNATRNDAVKFGFHYSNWRRWDKANDISLFDMDNVYKSNKNVTIYKKKGGPNEWTKIWGIDPNPSEYPLPIGWEAGPPPLDKTESYVLEFRNTSGWKISPLTEFSIIKDGNGESGYLKLVSGGYITMQSLPFSRISSFSGINLSIQEFAPVNPYWRGYIQVFIESKKFNVNNQWVGQMDLNSLPLNGENAIHLNLPEWLKPIFKMGASDLVIKINVIRPQIAGNMHFKSITLTP